MRRIDRKQNIDQPEWRTLRGREQQNRGMQHRHAQGEISVPVMQLPKRKRQLAMWPPGLWVVIHRNQQSHQNIQRKQHHRNQANGAGKIDRENIVHTSPGVLKRRRGLHCLAQFRDRCFDVFQLRRNARRKHLRFAVGDQHVVFDAHADALIFLKCRLHCGDELFVLRRFRQIVEHVRADVDAGLDGHGHARLQFLAACRDRAR